jgi:hypothetical protein
MTLGRRRIFLILHFDFAYYNVHAPSLLLPFNHDMWGRQQDGDRGHCNIALKKSCQNVVVSQEILTLSHLPTAKSHLKSWTKRVWPPKNSLM